MLFLHRSSKRRLAGLARFSVNSPQSDSVFPRKSPARRLPVEVEGKFLFPGRLLALLREAIRDQINLRQEHTYLGARLSSPLRLLPLLREAIRDQINLRQEHTDFDARLSSLVRLLPLLREAIRDQTDLRQEHTDLDARPSCLVQQTDDTVRTHVSFKVAFCKKCSEVGVAAGEVDRLSLCGKCTDPFKVSISDLAVDDLEINYSRALRLKKEHDADVLNGVKISNWKCFGVASCKGFLQFVKRDFSVLSERVSNIDSEVMSVSIGKKEEVNSYNECQIDMKELPTKEIGESSKNKMSKAGVLKIENSETSFHQEDKQGDLSQAASMLSFKNIKPFSNKKDQKESCDDEDNPYHDNIGRKSVPLSKKLKKCSPLPWKRRYFTILARKNKCKRKKNLMKVRNAKSWRSQPLKLKNLSLATSCSQIAALETICHVEKLKVSEKTSSSNYDSELALIVHPNNCQDSSGSAKSFCSTEQRRMKGSKMVSLIEKLEKQVSHVECLKDEDGLLNPASNEKSATSKDTERLNSCLRLENEDVLLNPASTENSTTNKGTERSKSFSCKQRFLKREKMHQELGRNCELFSRQESYREKETNKPEGSGSHEIVSKNDGSVCKSDASACSKYIGILCNGSKASSSWDLCPNDFMNPETDNLEGSYGDMYNPTDATKAFYHIRDLSLNSFYIILDLNGVLIKRWHANPSLPGVVKLNKKWIQLRPGCIEFLHKVFCQFKVGIWSTMTNQNVVGVCQILEQHAAESLPFFMQWSKDFCYQQKGVHRPDKSRVPADFKPLSHVWRFFEPYLGFHNTVLIDDSPYKACMNNQYNCIFPDAYEGCTDDNYLTEVLWPYLEKMRMSQNLQAYIANNPLGQHAVVVGHKFYHHVKPVVEKFNQRPIPLVQTS